MTFLSFFCIFLCIYASQFLLTDLANKLHINAFQDARWYLQLSTWAALNICMQCNSTNCEQLTQIYQKIMSNKLKPVKPGLKVIVHDIPSIPVQWHIVKYHKLIAIALCRN